MKIFVSTATVRDVQWATDGGLADGVMTSPATLRDAAGDGEEHELLAEICRAMRRLRADGVRVVVTLVFTAAQAVLAAKAGAFMVTVALDQLDAFGHDGTDVVRSVGTLFAAHGMECDVLAAQPQHAAQFARCAEAGADVVAVAPDVLRALLLHPLTDRGLDQFLRDLSVHRQPRPTV